MAHDPQAAATKQDVGMLMQEIGKLYMANEKWKNEILEGQEKWKDEILDANVRWKDEIIDSYKMITENLVYDFRGTHKDDITGIKGRLTRLEKHTGLATAA